MTQSSNKINWLVSAFIDYAILGIFIYYLIAVWKDYPSSVGGSLVLISVIGIGYYFSLINKALSYAITMFSLILFSFMVLNFLAYIEYINGFSVPIMIWILIVALIIFISILILICLPLESRRTFNSSKQSSIIVELRRKFNGTVGHFFITISFIGMTAIFFMTARDYQPINAPLLNIVPFVIFWLLMGLVLVFSLFKMRSNLARHIPYLVIKKSRVDTKLLKRWFYIISISILFVGTLLEISRGFWSLWGLTWMACNLVVLVGWETWKYVFQEDFHNINDINEDDIRSIPSLLEPSNYLKVVGISTVIGIIYLFALIKIFW